MQIRVHSRHHQAGFRAGTPQTAFSLLEVIIACAIFFMAAFAILGVVTQGLASARKMRNKEPDPGLVAAQIFAVSNIVVEGTESGSFEDLFPGLYPGYSWTVDKTEISSNSLFRLDITVYGQRGSRPMTMSVLKYAPGSPPGSASQGAGGF